MCIYIHTYTYIGINTHISVSICFRMGLGYRLWFVFFRIYMFDGGQEGFSCLGFKFRVCWSALGILLFPETGHNAETLSAEPH